VALWIRLKPSVTNVESALSSKCSGSSACASSVCHDDGSLRRSHCNYNILFSQAISEDGKEQLIPIYNGPLVQRRAKRTNSWKSCHYVERGYWDSARQECHFWQYVSNLCYKMNLDSESGEWQPSAKYGGYGCAVSRKFDPITFGRLPVLNWRSSVPPSIKRQQVTLCSSPQQLRFQRSHFPALSCRKPAEECVRPVNTLVDAYLAYQYTSIRKER
jgi:hypothetical protein